VNVVVYSIDYTHFATADKQGDIVVWDSKSRKVI